MHPHAFSSIFHAFNIQYSRIAEIAPALKEMGFTHIQFPPIQPTRELTPLDIELLQKQVKQYSKQLMEFSIQCERAREKNTLYGPHTFDYLLQKRIYYIREPTFRHMHQLLLDIPYSELYTYIYETPPYSYAFRNEIQNILNSDVSIVVKLMTSVHCVGPTHPYAFLSEIADILGHIHTYKKDLCRSQDTLGMIESEYAVLHKQIDNLRMQRNSQIPVSLLNQWSEIKKRRSRWKTEMHQYKQYMQNIQILNAHSDKLKLFRQRASNPQDILSELQQIHRFGPTVRKPPQTIDPKNSVAWLNRIFLLETLLFSPWWLIYQPLRLSIGSTFLGSLQDIRTAISACKKHGLSVIADVVINNLAAVGGEKDAWAPFVQPGKQTLSEVVPRDTNVPEPFQKVQTLLLDAFACSDLTMLTPPYPCKEDQEPTHCWMSGALPQLVQSHPIVQDSRDQFIDSLRELGVDGVRIDAAVHLEPWVCEEVLSSMPGLSYIEYVGNSKSAHLYLTDSYAHLRLEDFAIGEDLYASIFSEKGEIERTTNYGSLRLQRHPQLDSVVMVVNHDHVMGSIPSKVFIALPSRITYELSVAYLVQRIYGHVLLMPHDIEFPFVQTALLLRTKMREHQIVREFVHTDTKTGTLYIEKYNSADEMLFLSILHVGSRELRTQFGVVEPYSFVWFSVGSLPECILEYNTKQNTWLRNCYSAMRKRKWTRTRTRKLAKHTSNPDRNAQNRKEGKYITPEL